MPGYRRCQFRAALLAGGLGLLLGLSGCWFGPKALEKTHSQYNETIRRVYEEQLLQNLVRLRYEEMPFRLNVQSIAAQYELAGSAEARPFFLAPNPSGKVFKQFTSILPDLQISGANRPTITLIPSSSDAVRRFLTPISADTLLFLSSTSWPVSTVLRLWVERLNGVPNAVSASGPQRDFIPDFARFQRVAHLMQVAQDLELILATSQERSTPVGGPLPSGAINAAAAVDAAKNGLEYREQSDGSWVLTRKERVLVIEVNPSAIDHPVVVELGELLNLRRGQRRYEIVVTSDAADPLRFPDLPSNELRLTPRSTAQVYYYLANGIELPPEHLAAGIVRTPRAPDGSPFDTRAVTAGLFTVHTCKGHKPPPNAYVAVKYRGYWYYIDDRDQASKTTFALTLELSRLDFGTPEGTSGPFLTLPVGR
ncbi:MAG: hypothetical protein ACLQGP_16230 [Isosphaeraceae bacterium]